MKRLIGFISVAVLLVIACGSQADLIAYTEGGTSGSDGGWKTVGFSFSVSTAIDVTQLGFFGESLGGGDTPNVYLHDVTGASTLRTASWIGGANAGWNYKAVTTVTLSPGNVYQVSAPLYWTQVYDDTSGFSFAPEISLVNFYRDDNVGGWTDDHITTVSTATPYIGGNLQYTVVPEPSALGLLLLGGTVAMVSRLKRRR
ncbi:MAG: PEP-CTERM sorting domain-containing protein [Verrucomicrobia bacterium]|nr:PEP-CTERM sorting domain-containing protein [Verrucomicrobiota bacterium]